jgi:transcriptional antiterminator RfaH
MSQQTFGSSYPTNDPLFSSGSWHLIKTKTHAEELAQNSLRQHQITAYLPRLLTGKAKSAELKAVPLFPGYLFFQLAPSSRYWSYVRWAPGVSYVLSDDYGPITLPENLIQEIAFREEQKRNITLLHSKRPFEPGERLEVVSGPFTGLEAVFERPLSANNRVQVLVQILGRLTRVSLESGAVKRPNSLLLTDNS